MTLNTEIKQPDSMTTHKSTPVNESLKSRPNPPSI